MKKISLLFLLLLLGVAGVVKAATLNCYAPSSDGSVFTSSSSWATVKAATTGTVSATNSFDYGNIYYIASWSLFRHFFMYDTSGLPDDAIISSVVAHIHFGAHSYGTSGTVVAQKGTQGDTLDSGDIDNFTGTEYGHISMGTQSAVWKEITFNATGRADINKTGTTYVCYRDYTYDYLDSTPSQSDDYLVTYNYAESGFDSYLTVTYTLPPTYNISGTLKENDSDASGKAYKYFILDATDHVLLANGTAASDGTWSEQTDNDTDEYCGVMYDNINGAVYDGNYQTDTTSSGAWTMTDAGWADGDTVWAFFVDPDKVYKTIAAEFTANGSNTVSGTHQENGVNATGTLVFGFGFGTTSGTYNPKPFFDFVSGE